MTANCLVATWIVLLASPLIASEPEYDPMESRTVSAIKADVQHALRAEAIATSLTERRFAILHLVDLLDEVSSHPKTLSPPLRRVAARVRVRLQKVRLELPTIVAPDTAFLAQQPGLAGGPPFQAPAANTGWADELIEVIERTVQRDIWVSAGGPATIAFFAPSHALVISAPQSVHDEVAALLTALRAAGP